MQGDLEASLARRGSFAFKLGATVVVISTALYYLLGCLCGMNARYGKSFWTTADDRWELTECVYASVITLTTVGYTDLLGTDRCEVWRDAGDRYRWVSSTDFHEDPGFDESTARLYADYTPLTRLATCGLVVVGISFFLYVIAQMTSFFVEGEYRDLRWSRRNRKMLRRLEGHAIICGAGEVARNSLTRLLAEGVPCVLIEQSADRIRNLRSEFPRVACLLGDATEEELLVGARIQRARAVVSALPDDPTNLVAVVVARQLDADVAIIARGIEDSAPRRLQNAGATVTVCTPALAGLRIASELIRPSVVDFLDVLVRQGEAPYLSLRRITVGDRPSAVRVSELASRGDAEGFGCVAIHRSATHRFEYNPSPAAEVQPGDELVVIAGPSQSERLRELLGEPPGHQPPPLPIRSASDEATEARATPEPDSLTDHYVLCGGGDTGLHVARELRVVGRSFVIIEKSAKRLRELATELPGIPVIRGDAQDLDTLRQAAVERARGIATVLPSDRANLVAAVTSIQIQPRLRAVSIANQERHQRRLTRAGVRVVSQGKIGGRRMAAAVLSPTVTSFLDLMLATAGAVRFEGVVVSEGAPMAGQLIDGESLFRACGLRIVAVRENGEGRFVVGPSSETVLRPGMVLIVVGTADQVERLANLAGRWE